MHSFVVNTLRRARQIVVAVNGGSLLLIGAAMIVLPGPAVVVIPAGLVILATEFVWARKLLQKRFWKQGAGKDSCGRIDTR